MNFSISCVISMSVFYVVVAEISLTTVRKHIPSRTNISPESRCLSWGKGSEMIIQTFGFLGCKSLFIVVNQSLIIYKIIEFKWRTSEIFKTNWLNLLA